MVLASFFFPLFLILRSLFHHRFQGQKRIKIQHVATEFWIHISNQDFFPHKQFAPVFLLVIFYVPLVGLKQVMHFIMIPKGLAWFNQDNIVQLLFSQEGTSKSLLISAFEKFFQNFSLVFNFMEIRVVVFELGVFQIFQRRFPRQKKLGVFFLDIFVEGQIILFDQRSQNQSTMMFVPVVNLHLLFPRFFLIDQSKDIFEPVVVL